MTQQERDVVETIRQFLIDRSGGICEYEGCTEPGTQIAHMIAKSKMNIKMYGAEIVHHPKLLRWSCAKHNSYFNRGFRPEWIAKKITEIEEAGIENWRDE